MFGRHTRPEAASSLIPQDYLPEPVEIGCSPDRRRVALNDGFGWRWLTPSPGVSPLTPDDLSVMVLLRPVNGQDGPRLAFNPANHLDVAVWINHQWHWLALDRPVDEVRASLVRYEVAR